jgi:hypothetical protein
MGCTFREKQASQAAFVYAEYYFLWIVIQGCKHPQDASPLMT